MSRRSAPDVDRPPVELFGRGTWPLHAVMLLGVSGCGVAAWIEWSRALTGHHEIAWAYAFEWPLFAGLGVWVWWTLLRAGTGAPSSDTGSSDAATDDAPRQDGGTDPQLQAWQDYLARLHAADPPGGPPPRRS